MSKTVPALMNARWIASMRVTGCSTSTRMSAWIVAPVSRCVPVEAIYYEDDLPEQWSEYYTANVEFFVEVGSPGGAAKVGVIHSDHAVVSALPPQN
jgi:hypothetical protein